MKSYFYALLIYFVAFVIVSVVALLFGAKVYKKAYNQSLKSLNASLIIDYMFVLINKIETAKKNEEKKNLDLFNEYFGDIIQLPKHLESFDFDEFISNIKIEQAQKYNNSNKTSKESRDELLNRHKKIAFDKILFAEMILCYNLDIFYDKSVIAEQNAAFVNLAVLLIKKNKKLKYKKIFYDFLYKLYENINKLFDLKEMIRKILFANNLASIHNSIQTMTYYSRVNTKVFDEFNNNNFETDNLKCDYAVNGVA